MASACFSRCEQARFCAIAHAAKACRDLGKSQIDMSFDIFEEDGKRGDLGDDALDVGPKVTWIARASTATGKAEGLAGIAGREDIHAAAPRSAVEGFEIVPYRCLIQGLVCHPRHESGRGVSFPLDVTDSSISRFGDCDAEIEAGIASAEGQTMQPCAAGGTCNHNAILRGRLVWRSEKGSGASIG